MELIAKIWNPTFIFWWISTKTTISKSAKPIIKDPEGLENPREVFMKTLVANYFKNTLDSNFGFESIILSFFETLQTPSLQGINNY